MGFGSFDVYSNILLGVTFKVKKLKRMLEHSESAADACDTKDNHKKRPRSDTLAFASGSTEEAKLESFRMAKLESFRITTVAVDHYFWVTKDRLSGAKLRQPYSRFGILEKTTQRLLAETTALT